MKRAISLRYYLLIPVATVFLIAATLVLSIVHQVSLSTVRSSQKYLAKEIATGITASVNNYFGTIRSLAEINRDLFHAGNISSDSTFQLARHFLAQLEHISLLTFISYGRANGEYVGAMRDLATGEIRLATVLASEGHTWNVHHLDSSGNRGEIVEGGESYFNSTVRPWFKHGVEAGEISWYPVYKYATYDALGIGVSAPVYSNDSLSGVYTVDFSLHHLSELLRSKNVGAGGAVAISDTAGFLMATSLDESVDFCVDGVVERYRLDSYPDRRIQKLAEHDRGYFSLHGEKYYHHRHLYSGPYGIQLYIDVILYERDLSADSLAHLQKTLFILGGVGVVALLILLYIARSVIRPVEKLIDHTRNYTKGVNTSIDLASSVKEFSELASTITNMEHKLRISMEMLQLEVSVTSQQLEESEDRYRVLFTDSPTPYFILEKGVFIDCNRAAESILGCDLSEIVGHTPEEFSPPFQPDGRPSDVAGERELAYALENRKTVQFEWLHRRRSGEEFWATITAVGTELSGRTVLLAMMTDISSQKQTEAELIDARREAEAASRAKSEFLANMSHEIRTPLNGVIGFTDLLSRTPLTPLQEQYVQNANTSGKSLLGIINDILDFSKIEAGMLELDLAECDLIKLCESAISIVKYAAAQQDLELILNLDPKMDRYVVVDSVRFRQVLINLLANAVKFTMSGEVELRVSFDEAAATYSFSVRDTGIGISDEGKKRLFRAFSQADSSTTREFGGTGLGLSISDSIIRKMGSSISVESVEGLGSIFSFTIALSSREGDAYSGEIGSKLQRVVVVDNNPMNCTVLEAQLRERGLYVESYYSAESAVNRINEEPFDLLLVDYHMPVTDGLSLVSRLREMGVATPVALLHSATDDLALHRRCDELGVEHRLVKPVGPDNLFDLLVRISGDVGEKPLPTPICDRRKMRILVAEDNPLNMALIEAMINDMLPSSSVIGAANGAEAVELWEKESPDIILMDMQMPVVGGVEATEKIRRKERSVGGHVIISALTAGALKGEEIECRKAGMDAFLTKPLERKALEELFSYFGECLEESEVEDNQPASYNEKTEKAEKTTEIFVGEELLKRLGGSAPLFKRMLEMGLTELPHLIDNIEEALRSENREDARRYSHQLKGSAANMCLPTLSRLASEIETIYADVSMEVLFEALKEMREVWHEIAAIFEEECSNE